MPIARLPAHCVRDNAGSAHFLNNTAVPRDIRRPQPARSVAGGGCLVFDSLSAARTYAGYVCLSRKTAHTRLISANFISKAKTTIANAFTPSFAPSLA